MERASRFFTISTCTKYMCKMIKKNGGMNFLKASPSTNIITEFADNEEVFGISYRMNMQKSENIRFSFLILV